MGTMNALKMRLDFLFNTKEAVQGVASLTKGFNNFGNTLDIMKNFIPVHDNMTGSINQISENLKNAVESGKEYGDVLNNYIKSGNSIDGLAGGMERLYEAQIKVGQSIKTAGQIDILTGAVNVLDRAYINAGSSANQLHEILKGFDPKGDRFNFGDQLTEQIIELEGSNEKLAKEFREVNSAAAEFKKNLNGKQLVQYSTLTMKLAEEFAHGTISAKAYTKQLEQLNHRTTFLNQTLPKLKGQLAGLAGGTLSTMTTALGALRIMDDAVSAQAQTVETTHRLALANATVFEGAGENAKSFTKTVMDMNKAVRDVGTQTGVSMTRAAEAMNSLAAARVSDNIDDLNELAITSIRMSQAFGISEGAAADLMRQLVLVGGLDVDSVNAMAEEMADVQAVFGLTAEEATEVTAQVGKVINRMTAMGANSIKNAKIVAKEVAKMTTSFTKAGLSAQDASGMIDRFMDPTKLEDNVLLWHSMGISVADGLAMMTGDASAMEGMTEKLTATAVQLKEQYGGNALALQAMAEAHGMTIQQINQLTNAQERQKNMSAEEIKKMEEQATLESQAEQARQSMKESLTRLAFIGNVLMQTFLMPLIDILTPIASKIAKVAQGFTEFTKKLGPFGGAIRGTMGLIILFTALTKTNLLKLLMPIGKLGEGFGGMFGGIASGAKKGIAALGKFVTLAAGKLKNKALSEGLGKLGSSMQSVAGGDNSKTIKGGASNAIGDKSMDNGTDATSKLSKINGKGLMQVGIGLAAIAAAVFLLALAFKVLVDVVQNASGPDMIKAGLIMALMMVGLGAAAFALGKISAVAGPEIMLLGGAMLMVAGSVAILAGAFWLLNEVIQNDGGWKTFGIMAAMMAILVVAVLALAAAGTAAAVPLITLGGAMLMIAGSIAILGAGLFLIGWGLDKIIQAISKTGKEFAEGAKNMAAGIFSLLIPLGLLGIVGGAAALGLSLFAIAMAVIGLAAMALVMMFNVIKDSITGFVDGLRYISENAGVVVAGLAVLGAGLLLLGIQVTPVIPALLGVGLAFVMMGAGMALVGLGFKFFSEGIAKLSGNIGTLALGLILTIAAFTAFVTAINFFIVPIATAIIAIAALGVATIILGAGMALSGLGMQLMAKGFASLTEHSKTMLNTSIELAKSLVALAVGMGIAAAIMMPFVGTFGAAAITLGLFALVALSIGAAFKMMGTGTQLLAKNAVGAIEGIKGIKSELGGMKDVAKDYISSIDDITTSFIKLGQVQDKGLKGLKAYKKIVHDIQVEVKKSGDVDKAAAQMDTANEHLNKISGFTSRTALAVEKLADTVKGGGNNSFVATMETGL